MTKFKDELKEITKDLISWNDEEKTLEWFANKIDSSFKKSIDNKMLTYGTFEEAKKAIDLFEIKTALFLNSEIKEEKTPVGLRGEPGLSFIFQPQTKESSKRKIKVTILPDPDSQEKVSIRFGNA